MARTTPRGFALAAVMIALMVAGCSGARQPQSAATPRGPRDPLISAALKASGATTGTIIGYQVDFVVDVPANPAGHVPPGTKNGLLLTVLPDGSLREAPGLTPNSFPSGPEPPARAQPESASARTARESALAVAQLNVGRASRSLAGATALVYRYYVRVQLASGETRVVGIGPDAAPGSVVISRDASAGVSWPPWAPWPPRR